LLAGYSPETQVDPTRVLQGVVGGIGFLGAGSIIHSRGTVEGVTTAATVWVAGAIGAGCGLGNYVLVAILVGFCFLTLVVLGRIGHSVAEPNEPNGTKTSLAESSSQVVSPTRSGAD